MGVEKVLPHLSHPIEKLQPLRFSYDELRLIMAVLEFPRENNSGREVLIDLPDGAVMLRSDVPITVQIALYLLERAKARILLSLENLDKVHG